MSKFENNFNKRITRTKFEVEFDSYQYNIILNDDNAFNFWFFKIFEKDYLNGYIEFYCDENMFFVAEKWKLQMLFLWIKQR